MRFSASLFQFQNTSFLGKLSVFFQCWPWRAVGLGVAACLLLMLAGCGQEAKKAQPASFRCERIVSLSPSVTEVLYELDLDAQLVGVTRFCNYPAAAKQKPQVGGYVDPDMETLLRLRPSLVIVREEQNKLVAELRRLDIPVLPIDHRNVDGILASFQQIGQICQREPQAQQIVAQLQARMAAVQRKVAAATSRPRVLVTVDRDIQAQRIRWVYVAAEDGFFDWMIHKAGGQNATPPGRKGFLQVSAEGILRMNPDIILETLPSINGVGQDAETARRQWQSLPQVNAVKTGRVYLFDEDYVVIPGPRFIKILEAFAEAIHPELH